MSYNIYDLILAVQYFKPETLDFLDSIRYRYTYSTEAFINQLKVYFQKLPIEIDGDKKTGFPNPIGFSIEKDWSKLKKIREKAKSLPEQDTIKLEELGKKPVKEFTENIITNNTALLNNIAEAYQNDLWDELTREWIKLVLEHANKEWRAAVLEFVKEFEVETMTFQKYLSIKKSGLGVRVENSPKLYYNNIRQIMIDIVRQYEALKKRKSFIKEWMLIKHNILNSQILHPWILKTLDINPYELLEDGNNNLVLSEKDGAVIQIKMKEFGPSRLEIVLK